MATGYQGFGSFHSDNVELLIAEAASSHYVDPPYPSPSLEPAAVLAAAGCVPEGASTIRFGQDFRKHFFLDPDWTFVNHGAFGGTCRVAMEAGNRWRVHAEMQPLLFIDRQLFTQVVRAIKHIAGLVHASPANLVFVPNATAGLNCAIAAAQLQPKDVVFMLDIGYGSVKKMLAEACAKAGAALVTHPMVFPVSGIADIVAQVSAGLEAAAVSARASGGSLALCVFDHVTSNTALVLPVAELTTLAHGYGARVLIDGAHGLQSQDVDLKAIGAEWYVSNCHKWLCSGKGAAILYAADAVRAGTRPLIISHGYGSGFSSDFIWDGCRDYSAVLAIPSLLQFWEYVGGHEPARAYCRGLLREAVGTLTARWGTSTHAPLQCYSHMACVELPLSALPPGAVVETACGCKGGECTVAGGAAGASAAGAAAGSDAGGAAGGAGADAAAAHAGSCPCRHVRYAATSTHAKMVQDRLHYEYRIEVPVKCLPTAPAKAGVCGTSRGGTPCCSRATAGDAAAAGSVTPAGPAGGAGSDCGRRRCCCCCGSTAAGDACPASVPPSVAIMGMRLYLRISAAVYNDKEDYDHLADVIASMRWGAPEPAPTSTDRDCKAAASDTPASTV
jgi:selenocysteine lyase/cysteine desulfurase